MKNSNLIRQLVNFPLTDQDIKFEMKGLMEIDLKNSKWKITSKISNWKMTTEVYSYSPWQTSVCEIFLVPLLNPTGSFARTPITVGRAVKI